MSDELLNNQPGNEHQVDSSAVPNDLGTETLLEERIVGQLRSVFDPEIPVNIYDLGLIYKIECQPALNDKFNVQIAMTLTAPGCPVAGEMPGMVKNAVAQLPELEDVDVALVWDPPWDKSRMSDEARMQLNFF